MSYAIAFAIGFGLPLLFDPGVFDSLNVGSGLFLMFVTYCVRNEWL